jgi:hypothetical protein
MFSNIIAELNKTATNCAAVRLESGATKNSVSNFRNANRDGVNFFNLSDASGNATNSFTGYQDT